MAEEVHILLMKYKHIAFFFPLYIAFLSSICVFVTRICPAWVAPADRSSRVTNMKSTQTEGRWMYFILTFYTLNHFTPFHFLKAYFVNINLLRIFVRVNYFMGKEKINDVLNWKVRISNFFYCIRSE